MRLSALLVVAFTLMAVGPLAGQASASHFRHGNLNWTETAGAPAGSQRITVQYEQSWRWSHFGNPAQGSVISNSEGCIDWGDGTTQTCPQYLVEFVNAAEDYMRVQALAPGSQTDANVPHDYADPSGSFTISTDSCCTIGSLNNARNRSWNILATVNLAGEDESAFSTVPAIVTLEPGGLRKFTVPAADRGGEKLFFRLSDAKESCVGCTDPHPSGLSIDSRTGEVTFDTTDKSGLYWTGVVIESRNFAGAVVATSHIQYIISVRTGSVNRAPAWDSPPTPADGTVFTVSVGNTVNFTMRASDPDANDTVSVLKNSGPGTFAPTNGNPGSGAYSFTPTAADAGQDHIVQFIAQDQDGAGPPFRSYTIRVTPPDTVRPKQPPDRTPPETTLTGGPAGPTSDSTPTFTFVSNEPGSTFQCSIDGGPFSPCSSPFTTPPLSNGAHTFQVRAIDPAGNVDSSPASGFDASAASRRFTVVAQVANPTLGRSVSAEPVGDGPVFVSLPAGAVRASASVPGLKGRTFIPLREARSLPVGSIFDTRKGTVRLTSARNRAGATQSSEFVAGVFQVLQSRKRSAKGLTELRLKGASFRSCGRRARGSSAEGEVQTARRSRRRIRRLRGNGRGRFRTRGRYSSATVRGTDWTVTDRCDGTLTKVRRGRVAVRDFRRRKTVTVRAGRSYLARPRARR